MNWPFFLHFAKSLKVGIHCISMTFLEINIYDSYGPRLDSVSRVTLVDPTSHKLVRSINAYSYPVHKCPFPPILNTLLFALRHHFSVAFYPLTCAHTTAVGPFMIKPQHTLSSGIMTQSRDDLGRRPLKFKIAALFNHCGLSFFTIFDVSFVHRLIAPLAHYWLTRLLVG
jgi:hypothetical protein